MNILIGLELSSFGLGLWRTLVATSLVTYSNVETRALPPLTRTMILSLIWINMMNLVGLLPVMTNFPLFILMLSLYTWLSTFMLTVTKRFKHFVRHLTPESIPMVMAPALFVIESISSLIRPLTLGVRLAANIAAGHVLIGLVTTFDLGLGMQLGLTFYEIFVGLVQAIIFCGLLKAYWDEAD